MGFGSPLSCRARRRRAAATLARMRRSLAAWRRCCRVSCDGGSWFRGMVRRGGAPPRFEAGAALDEAAEIGGWRGTRPTCASPCGRDGAADAAAAWAACAAFLAEAPATAAAAGTGAGRLVDRCGGAAEAAARVPRDDDRGCRPATPGADADAGATGSAFMLPPAAAAAAVRRAALPPLPALVGDPDAVDSEAVVAEEAPDSARRRRGKPGAAAPALDETT